MQIAARVSVYCVLSIMFLVEARGQSRSLDEALEKIGPPRSLEISAEEYKKLDKFRGEADPAKMMLRLDKAREELASLQSRQDLLRIEVEELRARVDATSEELIAKATAFGEMLGQFRLAATRVVKKLDRSFISFEYPGRSTILNEIASARTLPTPADLMTLPRAIIQEMEAQGEVKRIEATVTFENADDRTRLVELLRIGAFTAVTVEDVAFVVVRKVQTESENSFFLTRYSDQPGEPYRSMMVRLLNADPDQIVRVPIDRSSGVLLMLKGSLSGKL